MQTLIGQGLGASATRTGWQICFILQIQISSLRPYNAMLIFELRIILNSSWHSLRLMQTLIGQGLAATRTGWQICFVLQIRISSLRHYNAMMLIVILTWYA
jgi:tryptophan-rich sensory protein